jgi:putative transposase
MDSSRKRLRSRLERLPPEQLDLVERFLDLLNETYALRAGEIVRNRSTSEDRLLSAQVAASSNLTQAAHKDWPHAPLHRISEAGTYIVTSGTLHKEHCFRGPERLDLLESSLLRSAKEHSWRLEAWAVFSNHYHFVGNCTTESADLKTFVKQLHGATAVEANRLDGAPGRQVWHNYWDTQLTYEKSYLARLNYVHQNAVRHGLVAVANQYRFCSAAWFERTATPAQVKTIYGFKIDKLRIQDDFEPV